MDLKSALQISLQVSKRRRKQSFDFDLDSWYSKPKKHEWLIQHYPTFLIPDSSVATSLLVVPATSAFLIGHRPFPVAHQFWAVRSGSVEWYWYIIWVVILMYHIPKHLLWNTTWQLATKTRNSKLLANEPAIAVLEFLLVL